MSEFMAMLAEYGVAVGNAVGGSGGFTSGWVDTISDNPTAAVAVGVGVAFLLWLFFAR